VSSGAGRPVRRTAACQIGGEGSPHSPANSGSLFFRWILPMGLVAMAHDKKHARLVATQGLEGLDDDEASPLNLDTAPVDAAHPIEGPRHYTDAT